MTWSPVPAPPDAALLAASAWIDADHPAIRALAERMAPAGAPTDAVIAAAFAWVKDRIRHSGDAADDAVTCRASDVLRHGTGWCYAKAHLLAALLRARGVPCGLGYQRLSVDGAGPPYCLHGLAVVRRPQGWLRIDARGDRPGVAARFAPPVEHLAFVPALPGEGDLPGIWADPWPAVVRTLTTCRSAAEVLAHLPDHGEVPP